MPFNCIRYNNNIGIGLNIVISLLVTPGSFPFVAISPRVANAYHWNLTGFIACLHIHLYPLIKRISIIGLNAQRTAPHSNGQDIPVCSQPRLVWQVYDSEVATQEYFFTLLFSQRIWRLLLQFREILNATFVFDRNISWLN